VNIDYSRFTTVDDGHSGTINGIIWVVPGTYYFGAIIDINENDFYYDSGDFIGIYGDINPNADPPNVVVEDTKTTSITFTLRKQ